MCASGTYNGRWSITAADARAQAELSSAHMGSKKESMGAGIADGMGAGAAWNRGWWMESAGG